MEKKLYNFMLEITTNWKLDQENDMAAWRYDFILSR